MYCEFLPHEIINEFYKQSPIEFVLGECIYGVHIVKRRGIKIIMFQLKDAALDEWCVPSRWSGFVAVEYGKRTFIFGKLCGFSSEILETIWKYKGECNLQSVLFALSILFKIT